MVNFNFIQILKVDSVSMQCKTRSDATAECGILLPQSVASDLDLHCLPTSHKKNTRLIWVKTCSMPTNINPYGYHDEYFMYYSKLVLIFSISLQHSSYKHVFLSRVENSVDLDQIMASSV